MSRSRRRTPITGITSADSEKADKRRANRAVRRALRQDDVADPDAVLPGLRDVSDTWSMAKDGKRWLGHGDPRPMRK
ncbi:hypothetical protein M0638_18190 [Roseomonas sp. NAR14]|uniref:Uncharacterized protein n=1 Tax=Roseomonas acroporae TaxID=2937791 RepID=A0A9X2BWQ0_9PROT|nr:hypothetical protein [Roseomonas acroporae]MCK8786311.1 hypothetical protein [Roseomonas acroporae]